MPATAHRNTPAFVIDYAGMRRPDEGPRRLHRLDCHHAPTDTLWREASPQELSELEPCQSCLGAGRMAVRR